MGQAHLFGWALPHSPPLCRTCESPRGEGRAGGGRRRRSAAVGAGGHSPLLCPLASPVCRCPAAEVGLILSVTCLLGSAAKRPRSGAASHPEPQVCGGRRGRAPPLSLGRGPTGAYSTAIPPEGTTLQTRNVGATHARLSQSSRRTPRRLHSHQPVQCPGPRLVLGLPVQAGKATAAREQISDDDGNARLGARRRRAGGGGWDSTGGAGGQPQAPLWGARPGSTSPYRGGQPAQGARGEIPTVTLGPGEAACLSPGPTATKTGCPAALLRRRDLIVPSSQDNWKNAAVEELHQTLF